MQEKFGDGSRQLADSARLIAQKKWLLPIFERIRRIIPVLLVHEHRIAAPGIPEILISIFRRELRIPEEHHTDHRLIDETIVYDPVLIDIDDMELMETSVRNFALEDVFEAYVNAHADRNTPFHSFLALNNNRYPTLQNEHLHGKVIDFLGRASLRLFGKPAPLVAVHEYLDKGSDALSGT